MLFQDLFARPLPNLFGVTFNPGTFMKSLLSFPKFPEMPTMPGLTKEDHEWLNKDKK